MNTPIYVSRNKLFSSLLSGKFSRYQMYKMIRRFDSLVYKATWMNFVYNDVQKKFIRYTKVSRNRIAVSLG